MLCQDGSVLSCKARGVFRKDNITPCVGDIVKVVEAGAIQSIEPRKNHLVRPPIANVDNICIVLSAEKPKADLLLTDKLTATAYYMGIVPMILINKCDLANEGQIAFLQDHFFGTGIQVIQCSCMDSSSIARVQEQLRQGITVFAGQSGVGKSSILSRLIPGSDLEVGALSDKSGRGKHTTRLVELHNLQQGRLMADTPGFSNYDTQVPKPEELFLYFPEFRQFDRRCSFNTCLHDKEPDCAVKKAVAEGLLSKGRYQNYLKILQELKDKKPIYKKSSSG